MADNTGIEWTDATWNPVVGCSKVSEGCRNCYAMWQAHRNAAMGKSQLYVGLTEKRSSGVEWNGVVRTVPSKHDQPLRWKKPRKIFVNSMSDLFHPDVPFEFIDQVFAVMALSPRHTFQVLTKRPERMLEYFKAEGHGPLTRQDLVWAAIVDVEMDVTHERPTWPLPNVWLGVSVENQKTADERIPLLLQTPAAVRWLSMEPLLGAVDLTRFGGEEGFQTKYDHRGTHAYFQKAFGVYGSVVIRPGIDWVVVGGESGHRARPLHPHWVRSLRDQCKDARVPFLFKQWGEWKPINPEGSPSWCDNTEGPIAIMDSKGTRWEDENCMPTIDVITTVWEFQKLGKKAAGRVLDGVTHDEYPEPMK